ncbi:MAG: aminotransferase class IV [Opitutus sp.]|nr:aminotransferase class IV [Opitutus sp.]
MSTPFIQANTNGRLHPADEPSLTPLNRGFLYGDAIYEVWRTYEGVLFAWEEHFDRLEKSARALWLEIPWSRLEMLAEIKRTVAAFRQAGSFREDVYVRLQISRGSGPIGLDIGLADRAEYVLLVQPCPACPPEWLRRGMTLSIATALRRNPVESLNPAWKTGNYLNNIMGLREARARGADEVVLLNLQGEVTEASTSNLAFVRDGEVLTPQLGAGILAGITRGLLLQKIAPAAGVPAYEAQLHPGELAGMNECFLLSTTKDITPVGAIDELHFNVGLGTVTAKLKAKFAEYVRESTTAHPELKL